MLFEPGKFSIGIVLPVQPYDQSRDIDFGIQLEIARRLDAYGFDAVWIRDVPLNGSGYPDLVGHSDPWVLLGALASSTKSITLATGAIVLPLRHPLHIAKAAQSVDVLSSGRFALGLGSGDRPDEFAHFGQDHAARRDLFRDHWDQLKAALMRETLSTSEFDYEIRPRSGREFPLIAVGSSSQSLEWIARNARAWMTYHRPLAVQKDRISLWQAALQKTTGEFRGFGQVIGLELLDTSSVSYEEVPLGLRCGPAGLLAALSEIRAHGVHHVSFGLRMEEPRVLEAIEILAREVLPQAR